MDGDYIQAACLTLPASEYRYAPGRDILRPSAFSTIRDGAPRQARSGIIETGWLPCPFTTA
jgi:hypothetical protein